jgi:hypothetical protein
MNFSFTKPIRLFGCSLFKKFLYKMAVSKTISLASPHRAVFANGENAGNPAVPKGHTAGCGAERVYLAFKIKATTLRWACHIAQCSV